MYARYVLSTPKAGFELMALRDQESPAPPTEPAGRPKLFCAFKESINNHSSSPRTHQHKSCCVHDTCTIYSSASLLHLLWCLISLMTETDKSTEPSHTQKKHLWEWFFLQVFNLKNSKIYNQAFYIMHTFLISAGTINNRRQKQIYCIASLWQITNITPCRNIWYM